MEINKYYTPDYEEFCIGLEYEIVGANTVEKYVFGIDSEESFIPYYDIKYLKDDILDKSLQVKYLDREDIEAEGWIEDKRFPDNYTMPGFCLYVEEDKIIIDNGEEYEMEIVYFRGNIKNKSELRRLMKQLNIK